MHEGIDAAGPDPIGADRIHELARAGGDPVLHLGRKLCLFQEAFDDVGFIGSVERPQAPAQRTGLTLILVENHGTAKRRKLIQRVRFAAEWRWRSRGGDTWRWILCAQAASTPNL